MPIYEFYCSTCNTIYKFFSLKINTDKIPACPKCGHPELQKRVSLFATISKRKEEGAGEDGMPPVDERQMEKAMAILAREADKINEDDPRQAAQLMRKLTEATGMKMGSGMEEALRRLEKGEDPDQIEAEMGNILEQEDPFILEGKGKKAKGKPKPKIDNTLYDL
jgi:putative FmdB family regulatory protein